MAAEVQPLAQVTLAARPSSHTPEQTYWRSFRSPLNLTSPSNNAVTHISQPPVPPSGNATSDFFAVTTGARIQLYSHRTRKLVKTISRFDDTAYSGEVRYDGRVLVAGDETGTIQAFDANSRAILKTWKEQKQPVRTVKWNLKDPTSLMSCGDDNTVRLWELSSDTSIEIFRGHQDYVRCGGFLPGQSNNILVSGSYDQTVRLWDARIPTSAVMTFRHIGAVEDLLCMPSGSTLLAAADNQIAVLDITAGRPLHMIKNHQKTVTSLCLASQGSRVDKHIAVGMSSGQLSIKTRLSGEQKVKERQRQKEMEALLAGKIDDYDKKETKKRGRGWEKRFRGRDYSGDGADIIVQGNDRGKAKKLKPWEKELHRGRYSEALDIVLAGKDTMTIFTLLSNLRYRSALRKSLENRTDETLKPIMTWASNNLASVTFTPICVEVSMNIMDLYSKHLAEESQLAKQTEKLHARVIQEVQRSKEAGATQGMLQLLSPDLAD